MTQEDKDLLIKDLCGRLPYGVKVQYEDGIFDIDNISSIYEEIKLDTVDNYTIDVSEIKPYLFPLSSMTAEQKREYAHIVVMSGNIATLQLTGMTVQDWFNKNHFDYRGLIPKGLANDATDKNIY